MESQKFTKGIILFFLIIFIFIFAISISGSGDILTFFKALGAQILFAVFSYLIYISPDYKRYVIGINTKTIGISIIIGLFIGIAYVFLVRFIPGLAIAVPEVPASISDSLRFFVVNIVSPIFETIFFLGVILPIFRRMFKNDTIAIIIQALLFSFFHLGAYIIGLYNLDVSSAVSSFSSNVSVFISAFLFGIISGYLVTWKKYSTLLIAIIVHMAINLSTFIPKAIIFALTLSIK